MPTAPATSGQVGDVDSRRIEVRCHLDHPDRALRQRQHERDVRKGQRPKHAHSPVVHQIGLMWFRARPEGRVAKISPEWESCDWRDVDADGYTEAMSESGSRPGSFESLRRLPVIGRAMDWGLGPGAASDPTRRAEARISGLKVTESVCPYCAVGCSQVVYTRGGELVDIEGNPRSPVNQGTLCPKGASSRQLVQQPGRLTKVRYRRPGGTEWEDLELETAMDMIAERLIAAREDGWQTERARQAGGPHARVRAPRRGDARQRGELPHPQVVHGDGRGADREPGPNMTLQHGPRSGDLVRARRRHRFSAGPAERGLHPHPGLEPGRGAPGRVPLGDARA